MKELLTLLLTPPNIPQCCRNVCSRMLEDFHKFGSSCWSNLPEAEVALELGNAIHTGTLPQVTNNCMTYTAETVQSSELGNKLDKQRTEVPFNPLCNAQKKE